MRGDTYVPPVTTVPVRIRLSDGTTLVGKLVVPSAKALATALNSGSVFAELVAPGGEHFFVSKSQILSLTTLDLPKVPNLNSAIGTDDFDPHAVLGVERGATPEAIRQAYLHITKKYHPDRFASIELPEEIDEYLGAMARRINAAYAWIESEIETAPR